MSPIVILQLVISLVLNLKPAAVQCSKECQRLHWKSHRAVCDFLAAPVPDDLERENEHSNVVEHEEESNMALTSSLPSTSAARTKKSVACRTCKGEGKVSREKPNLLPFPRLESRTASFVLRELTCPDCGDVACRPCLASVTHSRWFWYYCGQCKLV
mmetsp:Transcript_41795/g.131790  ORF Transcript_41795/g.131790 Transcript_41795/m.131790 type:complete len:157 (-) Transcript_41795:2734-3204(-)